MAPLSARLAAAHPEWLGWVDDPWAQSAFAIAATIIVIIAVGALALAFAALFLLCLLGLALYHATDWAARRLVPWQSPQGE